MTPAFFRARFALRPTPSPAGSPRRTAGHGVICEHGHAVSQQAAKTLASRGFHAYWLEGGIALWRELGMPLMKKSARFACRAPGTPKRADFLSNGMPISRHNAIPPSSQSA